MVHWQYNMNSMTTLQQIYLKQMVNICLVCVLALQCTVVLSCNFLLNVVHFNVLVWHCLPAYAYLFFIFWKYITIRWNKSIQAAIQVELLFQDFQVNKLYFHFYYYFKDPFWDPIMTICIAKFSRYSHNKVISKFSVNCDVVFVSYGWFTLS